MNKETVEILEKLEKTADDFWNVSHQTGNFINMLINWRILLDIIDTFSNFYIKTVIIPFMYPPIFLLTL
jgi:hypothetical protein